MHLVTTRIEQDRFLAVMDKYLIGRNHLAFAEAFEQDEVMTVFVIERC